MKEEGFLISKMDVMLAITISLQVMLFAELCLLDVLRSSSTRPHIRMGTILSQCFLLMTSVLPIIKPGE